ncbi:MAG: pilus assembly protein N-terminal domain-containing protein [Thermoguttaceae bacterium]
MIGKSRTMGANTSSLRLWVIVSVVLSVVWAAEPLLGQPLPVVVPGGDAGQAGQQPAAPAVRSVRVSMAEPTGPVAAAAVAGDMPLIRQIQAAHERLEMTVNSSRILMLDQKMPQAQVDNPDLLDLVPLSPNQVQISAKKGGVTQVRLWGADKRIFSVDVVILGDARQLYETLRSEFPKTALTIRPVGNAVIISGHVDQQEAVPKIIRIAEEFYAKDKVINNMSVSGVQQVLLHVKVMEISRTKLRQLGFDFAAVGTSGNLFASGMSGLISATASGGGGITSYGASASQATGYLFEGGRSLFAVLEALRTDSLMKILSEPNLVAISGRPAYVYVGGSFGTAVSSISSASVTWQPYGTRVDMVPIVLGGGRIRLEVRPSVSQRDDANGVQGIPALKTREAETGVELRSGQTLAIAGLLEQQVEATNSGLPWVSEIPYIGALFRKVSHQTNEVELIITVTPELVDAMDANQAPPCGPGMDTAEPNDWELFMKGHLEVPRCCGGGEGGNCAAGGLPNGQGAGPGANGPSPAAPVARPYNTSIPSQPNIPTAATAALAAKGGNVEPPFLGPSGYDVVD